MGLFAELKRRNVFRVAIAYAVIAWVLAQVADIAFGTFGAPDWFQKSFMFLLMLGFPLAVFFAWAFEITPEGLKREKDVDRSQSITAQTGRKLDYTIIGVLAIAVVFLLFDRMRPQAPEASVAIDEPAVEAGEITQTSFERSIAVLPFENRSDRREDQFFTDGIHDDLLTTIANIGSLRVISRTSVMEYRDTTKKIPEIAAELGVANILEGGIQRSGNQVRINVQLIDAHTDEHLWAEIYDRELTAENLFSIQSEVSTAIARALQATLSPEEQERINTIGTTSLEAYEKYMLGRERWRERTADGMDASVELFLDAVELDENYAAAWAGLADAYRLQAHYSGRTPEDVLPLAEHAVKRALELDDQLAEAHTALGGLHNDRNEYELAVPAFERALELNPSYEWAYNWYGVAMTSQGRPDLARALYERGLEVDPLNPVLNSNLSVAYHVTGEFDKSMARAERLLEIAPESTMGYERIALEHTVVTGRLDEAARWTIKALEMDPDDISARSGLFQLYLSLGDGEAASRSLEILQEQSPGGTQTLIALHVKALYDGDTDSALAYAQQMLERDPELGLFTSTFSTLSRHDIANDNVEAAIGRSLVQFPEFEDPESTELTRLSMYFAVTTAYLYRLAGRDADAEVLANKALEFSRDMPILGLWGTGGIRAAAFVVLGDHESALADIRAVIDAGSVNGAWLAFDHSILFEPLHGYPEFQAMRAEVEALMAEQLANLQRSTSEFEW